MKLVVTKFYRDINSIFDNTPRDCYFGNNVNYIDYIELTQFLEDGIPTYTSEITKPNEILSPKASDYSVLIPYPSAIRSALGKTVREFFSLDKEYIYRVLVVSGGINRQIGFVDNSSIILDLSVTNRGFALTFTVYGAVRNWENHAKAVLFRNTTNYGINDISIDASNSDMITAAGLEMKNEVNLSSVVFANLGYHPKRTPMHKAFADTGIHTVLLDTLKAYGVAFDIEPRAEMAPNQWERLYMRLFYLNNGTGSTSLTTENFHKKGVLIEPSYGNIIIPLSEWNRVLHPAAARYEGYATGINYRLNNQFGGGRWGYELVKDWTLTDTGTGQTANINWMLARGEEPIYYVFSESNTTVFDLQMNSLPYTWYSTGSEAKKAISAPRFFAKTWNLLPPNASLYSDTGYPEIIETLCNFRFDLFLSTIRESREIQVPFNDIFALQAGKKFQFLNREYLINRVSNKNERKKSVQLYITRKV